MLRRYAVVSEIYAKGTPVGAHVYSFHFFRFQAKRKIVSLINYKGEWLTMRYAVWPMWEWELRPDCINKKFHCLECEETCEMNYV